MMKNSMRFFDRCRRMAAVLAVCTCVCMYFLAGCTKGGDDPIEDPNQPEPEKPVEVTLKLSTEDLAFEAKGGWKEFTINSSAAWTISGGNAWCQPGVTTGTGTTQVKVMVEAYTGTTDRNAVLTVKAGSLTVTLTVTQKAVHALTLTKDKFDVPQEGGNIDIEVKSNINYTVSIPTAFQEWIKEAPKAKAMETKNFRFTVAANEEAEKREGYIVISGNELKDTVYVYQAEGRCLILDKDSCTLSAREQELTVELRTNVDYEVVVPDSVSGWVSCPPESRALRTDKLRLLIGENGLEEERQAVVIVKDRNSELADTLHIRQYQANALALAQKAYDVPAEGGTISVELTTNIDYKVVIPDSVSGWVSRTPESRASRTDRLGFLIGENDLTKGRQAVVIIQDQDSEVADTLHIRQNQANALILGQKIYDVLAEGGTISVELITNIDYKVVIPDSVSGWISCPLESRALRTDSLRFLIGENDLTKERQAVVIIQDQNSELADRLHIRQSGKGEPEGPDNLFPNTHFRLEYKPNSATTVTFTVPLSWEAVINYEEEETGWLSMSQTNGEAGETNITVSSTTMNGAETQRKAYIDIIYGDETQRLTVTQLTYGDTDITDQFDPEFARVLQEEGYIRDATAITIKEIRGITALNLSNKGLTSIKGIDYFTELTELDVSKNAFTSLHVSISTVPPKGLTTLNVSGCTALTKLDCSSNRLTTLEVSGCSALRELDCRINELTTLDVSGCSALGALYCQNNQLTTLDVNGCTALYLLWCFNNQLTTLDVSGCGHLTRIDCRYNRLSKINIRGNYNLVVVDYNYNYSDKPYITVLTWFDEYHRPTGLSLKNFTQKTMIVEEGKGIFSPYDYTLDSEASSTTIEFDVPYSWQASVEYGGSGGWLSVSSTSGTAGETRLTIHASANRNTIKRNAYVDIFYGDRKQRINVVQNASEVSAGENLADNFDPKFAQTLQLQGYIPDSTYIVSKDLEQIMKVDVSGFQLTSLKGIEYFKALTELDCSNNKLTALDVSHFTTLTSLKCQNNELKTLDASFTALTSLNCTENPLSALYLNNCELTYLSLEQSNLTTLEMSYCTKLTSIKCLNNPQLTTLDVSGCEALTYLDCYNCQLTFLDLRTCRKLEKLFCSNNSLTALDVSKCEKLTSLSCKNNQLTTLNTSGCKALTYLYCNDNQFTTLDVSGCAALTQLDCYNNQLTELNMSKYAKFTKLNCYNNKLTTLNVSTYTNLTSLKCYDNQLTTLDMRGCTALTDLDCNNNKLNTLDVSQNMELWRLNCSNNNIPEILLINCTKLVRLECQNNKFSTLNLNRNTELYTLDCSGNQLTTLDVSQDTELTKLLCHNNPGDGVSSFPLTTWEKGNKPESLTIENTSWIYNGKTITITYQ